MTPDDAPPPDGSPRSTDALRLGFNVWLLRAHAADRRRPPAEEALPPARETPRRRRRRRQA